MKRRHNMKTPVVSPRGVIEPSADRVMRDPRPKHDTLREPPPGLWRRTPKQHLSGA